MEKKTHVMCANALSILIMKPDSISSLLVTTTFATLGGIIGDVDLKDSTTDKIFDRLMTSLVTTVLMSIGLYYLFDINLYSKIKELNDALNYIICIVLFILMAYLGSKSSHRSFTHSIVGCIVFSGILAYGFKGNVVIPFIISYASHIFLDLFNKKGVALFYPSKYRICFGLCEANGKVNKLLFILFSVCYLLIISLVGFNYI